MIKKKIIIVVGANGFIGRNLIYESLKNNLFTIGLCRQKSLNHSDKIFDKLNLINYEDKFDLDKVISEIKRLRLPKNCELFLIHASGPAHKKNISENELKIGIVESAIFFAKLARNINANFIYLSSISAREYENKKRSHVDSYGKNKLFAEKEIKNIFSKNLKALVILRLPAVWGKNAPGSFRLIEKLINIKIPLPINSIRNKRSYISINFLCNNIFEIINNIFERKLSNNFTFEITEGHYTLAEIIELISKENNIQTTFFNLPENAIKIFLMLIFKKKLMRQIFNPLNIDNSKFNEFLKKKDDI